MMTGKDVIRWLIYECLDDEERHEMMIELWNEHIAWQAWGHGDDDKIKLMLYAQADGFRRAIEELTQGRYKSMSIKWAKANKIQALQRLDATQQVILKLQHDLHKHYNSDGYDMGVSGYKKRCRRDILVAIEILREIKEGL